MFKNGFAVLLFVLAVGCQTKVFKDQPGTAGKRRLQGLLKSIVIPRLEFEEEKVSDVIRYLHQQSVLYDPKGKGINFFLCLSGNPYYNEEGCDRGKEETGEDDEEDEDEEWLDDGEDDEDNGLAPHPVRDISYVTLVADNMSLGDALKYVISAANLKYQMVNDCIIIASQDVYFGTVYPRLYHIEHRDAFGELEKRDATDCRFYATKSPLRVLPGCRLVFDNRNNILIVTGTEECHQLVEEQLKERNAYHPVKGFKPMLRRDSWPDITFSKSENELLNTPIQLNSKFVNIERLTEFVNEKSSSCRLTSNIDTERLYCAFAAFMNYPQTVKSLIDLFLRFNKVYQISSTENGLQILARTYRFEEAEIPVSKELISSLIGYPGGVEDDESDFFKGNDTTTERNPVSETLMKYLSDRGIAFPNGTTVYYNSGTEILTVTNTPEYIEALKVLLKLIVEKERGSY